MFLLAFATRKGMFQKIVHSFIVFTFLINLILPAGYAQSVLSLPVPGTMVSVSSAFNPVLIKGLKIHPENPLKFDFIVDQGDENLSESDLKKETTRLVKYFLASLTTPEKDLWVNLSPYEKDRIVEESFGATEMGRDLLAQDYILKQLTASLIYPEDELGKRFWEKVKAKAKEQYGTDVIPMSTFNKVWIVPERAVVYESGEVAFVADSRLRVMLEEDLLARSQDTSHKSQKEVGSSESGVRSKSEPQTTNHELDTSSQISSLSTDIIGELVLPEIEKEINEGKNFAQLRQIYNSLILATWFKQNLKQSLLGQVYVDKGKVAGVEVADRNEKQKIYEQYLEAYKRGVYNYIKEEKDGSSEKMIPRKYFSGGLTFLGLRAPDKAVLTTFSPATAGQMPVGVRENLAESASDLAAGGMLSFEVDMVNPEGLASNNDPALVTEEMLLQFRGDLSLIANAAGLRNERDKISRVLKSLKGSSLEEKAKNILRAHSQELLGQIADVLDGKIEGLNREVILDEMQLFYEWKEANLSSHHKSGIELEYDLFNTLSSLFFYLTKKSSEHALARGVSEQHVYASKRRMKSTLLESARFKIFSIPVLKYLLAQALSLDNALIPDRILESGFDPALLTEGEGKFAFNKADFISALPPLNSIPGIGEWLHVRHLELSEMPPEARKRWQQHERIVEIRNDRLGYSAYVGIHRHVPHPFHLRAKLVEGFWEAHRQDDAWLRLAWTMRKLWFGQWTLGGTRVKQFDSNEEAMGEVLGLSEAMAYKSILSVPYFGGGKVTVNVNFNPAEKENLQRKQEIQQDLARVLEQLQLIVTAVDINTSDADVIKMAESGPHTMIGVESIPYGGTTASPQTARGVILGMRAAVELAFPEVPTLENKIVALQGAGGVGSVVLDILLKLEKVKKVYLADINKAGLERIAAQFSQEITAGRLEILANPDDIYDVEADVFSPNAGPRILNNKTIPRLKVKVVAGAANIQLENDDAGIALHKRGILYVPDYVINSGGLRAVEIDIVGYSLERSIDEIYGAVKEVLLRAKEENRPTALMADEIARERITALESRIANDRTPQSLAEQLLWAKGGKVSSDDIRNLINQDRLYWGMEIDRRNNLLKEIRQMKNLSPDFQSALKTIKDFHARYVAEWKALEAEGPVVPTKVPVGPQFAPAFSLVVQGLEQALDEFIVHHGHIPQTAEEQDEFGRFFSPRVSAWHEFRKKELDELQNTLPNPEHPKGYERYVIHQDADRDVVIMNYRFGLEGTPDHLHGNEEDGYKMAIILVLGDGMVEQEYTITAERNVDGKRVLTLKPGGQHHPKAGEVSYLTQVKGTPHRFWNEGSESPFVGGVEIYVGTFSKIDRLVPVQGSPYDRVVDTVKTPELPYKIPDLVKHAGWVELPSAEALEALAGAAVVYDEKGEVVLDPSKLLQDVQAYNGHHFYQDPQNPGRIFVSKTPVEDRALTVEGLDPQYHPSGKAEYGFYAYEVSARQRQLQMTLRILLNHVVDDLAARNLNFGFLQLTRVNSGDRAKSESELYMVGPESLRKLYLERAGFQFQSGDKVDINLARNGTVPEIVRLKLDAKQTAKMKRNIQQLDAFLQTKNIFTERDENGFPKYDPDGTLGVVSLFPEIPSVSGADPSMLINIPEEIRDFYSKLGDIVNTPGAPQKFDVKGGRVSLIWGTPGLNGEKEEEAIKYILLNLTPQVALQVRQTAVRVFKEIAVKHNVPAQWLLNTKKRELNVPEATLAINDEATDSSEMEDKAVLADSNDQLGGIGLEEIKSKLKVEKDRNGVPLMHFDQMKNINIEGLTPLIINYTPATVNTLPFLLSFIDKKEEQLTRLP